MSVNIPQSFEITVPDANIDANIDGTINANLTGIPDHLTLTIDRLPKIQLGIDPVEIKPLDLSLRIKEFPSLRVHLPADFRVGLSLLGMELLTVRLCGKAQAITEPFKPNPCEVCRETHPLALDSGIPKIAVGEP